MSEEEYKLLAKENSAKKDELLKKMTDEEFEDLMTSIEKSITQAKIALVKKGKGLRILCSNRNRFKSQSNS